MDHSFSGAFVPWRSVDDLFSRPFVPSEKQEHKLLQTEANLQMQSVLGVIYQRPSCSRFSTGNMISPWSFITVIAYITILHHFRDLIQWFIDQQESLANAKVSGRQQCMSNAPITKKSMANLHSFSCCCLPNLCEILWKFKLIAVQGCPRSSILVSIEISYAISC